MFEFELDKLPIPVCRNLQRYVEACVKKNQANKLKPPAKPQGKTEFSFDQLDNEQLSNLLMNNPQIQVSA
jgi:hypothetical protein